MPPAPEPLYTPIEKPEPLDISVTAEPVIENQIIPSPLKQFKNKDEITPKITEIRHDQINRLETQKTGSIDYGHKSGQDYNKRRKNEMLSSFKIY